MKKLCLNACVWGEGVCVCVTADAGRGQKWQVLQELDQKVVVSWLIWVLGRNLGSSVRQAHALRHWVISPASLKKVHWFIYWIAEAKSHHIFLTGLELYMEARLASHSQNSTCFFFLSAWIKGKNRHVWLKWGFFFYTLGFLLTWNLFSVMTGT